MRSSQITALRAVEDAFPGTTEEVALALGVSRQAAYGRLATLRTKGLVDSYRPVCPYTGHGGDLEWATTKAGDDVLLALTGENHD